MTPEEVIAFYTQAIRNNTNWLREAILAEDTEEATRITTFLERAERELNFAYARMSAQNEGDHCNCPAQLRQRFMKG